jgi:hypothetical protein
MEDSIIGSSESIFVHSIMASGSLYVLTGPVRSIVSDILTECHKTTDEQIKWLLKMEAGATFTLNEHYFSDYREKFLESYRTARAEGNRGGDEDLRLEELIARDRFEPALQIMASVRGYFQGRSNYHSTPFPARSRLV